MWSLQVAAEALIATKQDLHAKIRGLDDEIDNKRDLLGDLVKRHDGGAAELAGAKQAADEDIGRLQEEISAKEQKLAEAIAIQEDLAVRLQVAGSLS